MADLIQLLPDSVANQIAAGEVIQRPASVVKELVENSIDSGADHIHIIIRDAGKTLIQIIDNGCGMSETDARMAFERHATSKIRKADDLFTIRTMGFRGEALASIAAIAHVELRTRRHEDELGTLLKIAGSEVSGQENVNCPQGSNLSVRNLFYNVPARRKFLKSPATEMRHIIDEFHRLTLANPDIAFTFTSDDSEMFNLQAGNKRQRIVGLFGKNINQNLVSVDTDTSIVKIEGFIGKPEFAKKTSGQQFFFVNNRYMKHPYFYNAVMNAYQNILPPDSVPSFFIYFDIDPGNIDINIHPTKTEIKFEEERNIWQIIQASVKESLGKFNIVPSIDFNTEQSIEIPVSNRRTEVDQPEIKINSDYNPFRQDADQKYDFNKEHEQVKNWERLYQGFEKNPEIQTEFNIQKNVSHSDQNKILQFRNKYILTAVKSGLMIIHALRALERINYEEYLNNYKQSSNPVQSLLYPQTIEVDQSDAILLKEKLAEIRKFGFNIDEFGKSTFVVNGLPPGFNNEKTNEIIDSLLEMFKSSAKETEQLISERIAGIILKAHTHQTDQNISASEMKNIIDRLFACKQPNYSPEGKKIMFIFNEEELDKKFK